MVKLLNCILLLLVSLQINASPHKLTQQQIFFISNGNECCYSQSMVDQVNQPTYEHKPNITLNLPELKEPASVLTWSAFTTLQLLDIYTTAEATKYDCVREVNPILGKSPTATDVVALKVFLLAPALWYTNKHETITDQDLAGINYMMTAVIANNFDVWNNAKTSCNKNR